MKSVGHLLCLSNGHGEDQVAVQVGLALQSFGIQVSGLPLVGRGDAYTRAQIPILDPALAQPMPSGGFVNQHWQPFWQDVQAGLLRLTWRQLQAVREQRVDGIVAVGDIVVQLMARWSGHPSVFIGTAKTDFYWRDWGGEYAPLPVWIPWAKSRCAYFPWERWLMRQCRGVIVRDALTAETLRSDGIRVLETGNPMMDAVAVQDPIKGMELKSLDAPMVLLLPGSRPPEAYRNWQVMMDVVQGVSAEFTVVAALSSGLDLGHLQGLIPPNRTIHLIQGHFARCAQRANLVLAMAGTAAEQCVGLGKPVITLPGSGPQFTPAFAQAQARLLGASLFLVDPTEAATLIETLWQRWQTDPQWRTTLRRNGEERMGVPGASQRIASRIREVFF